MNEKPAVLTLVIVILVMAMGALGRLLGQALGRLAADSESSIGSAARGALGVLDDVFSAFRFRFLR